MVSKLLQQKLEFQLDVDVDEVRAERINDNWPPHVIDGTFVASDIEDVLLTMGIGLIGRYKVTIEPVDA